jgi:hypothetical protein
MLKIIDIPTEQTTAATDVIMAILALIVTIKVYQTGKDVDFRKTRIWMWAFGLLTFASAIGAVAHGFQMSKLTNFILWQPLNLALGVAIGLFAAGVVYDFRNFSLPKILIPVLLVFAIVFFTITVLIPNAFIVFIIYEAIAMIFAFVVYSILASRKKIKGAGFMAAGILVTILAAAIQAIESIKVTFIWEFDHNGLFHIVQMIGLVILLKGLQAEFRSRATI